MRGWLQRIKRRMKISAKAEYACLAMLELARARSDDLPVRIREIAESHEIPERYLVQILLQLKGSGLVASTRGASGGYRLVRSPDQITLGEVLAAIEGPEDGPGREPANPIARSLESVWRQASQAQKAVLDSVNLSQLLERSAPRDWVI